VRGRGLVDNLATAPAIDECMCRQEPLRLAAQPSARLHWALPHLEADRQTSTQTDHQTGPLVLYYIKRPKE